MMSPLHVTPFVPGRARGPVHFGAANGGPEHRVVVLSYDELLGFSGAAAALVVVGTAPLAHPMLRLAGMQLPTVIIAPHQARELREGDWVTVDASEGLIGDPELYERPERRQRPAVQPGAPVLTADRVAVELRASVAGTAAAQAARRHAAARVGIVRTEYLLASGPHPPGVDALTAAFREVCEAAAPLEVTFRLLDLAADKRPEWLPEMPDMQGLLGLRGSRLYEREPVRSVYLAQVEALARVAEDHPVRMMLPYVVRTEDFLARREEILAHGGGSVPLGLMAETPAACLAMDQWLELAQFVSIGCNDLMQCLFGADRGVAELAGVLDPYAPVLYRFLAQVGQVAGPGIDRIQLCGVLPRVPRVVPVLVGLGYRNLCAEPQYLDSLSLSLGRTTQDTARALARAVCAIPDSAGVRTLLGLRETDPWSLPEAMPGSRQGRPTGGDARGRRR